MVMVTSEAAGRKRRGRRPSRDGIMGIHACCFEFNISNHYINYEKFKLINPCDEYFKEFFNLDEIYGIGLIIGATGKITQFKENF